MIVTVLRPPATNEWQVWIQMVPGNPEAQNESFIIGEGATFQDAKAQADAALREAVITLRKLQESEIPA